VVSVDFSRYRTDTRLTGMSIPISGNISGSQVISGGKTVMIAHAQTSPLTEPLHNLLQARNSQCLLLVPLLARGKVIGVIHLDTDQPERVFSATEVKLAETIAGQVAGAIANARLFEKQRGSNQQLQTEITERRQAEQALQQRNQELALINRASRQFNSSVQLNQVLQTILDEMHSLLEIVAASFWLVDPKTNYLICRHATGPSSDRLIGWELAPGQGLTGSAAQSGQALIIPDTHADPRHYRRVDDNTGLEVRSMISIPLKSKERVVGVLNLADTTPDRFTPYHAQLVEPIAAVAASAIENAWLFDQIQQANRRMQDELTLAREIQQSLLPAPNPHWPALEVICYAVPAHEIGGDFYRYHDFPASPAGPARYAFAVGDVSGKGVSAALLMAASLAQFDASLSRELTAPARLAFLDEAIAPYTRPRHQNCAMCYIELTLTDDATPALLEVVNAGCISPFIKRRTGPAEQPEVGGFALGHGLGAETGYTPYRTPLQWGDLVILTSDGVVEAKDPAGNMLGFDRLAAIITNGPASSAEALAAHLQQALLAFTATAPQHDDFTIMVIKV
jgi:serine phosphatase RsbU (regulator of sigma subunit)